MKRLFGRRRRKVKSDDGDGDAGGFVAGDGLPAAWSTAASSGTPDAESGYRYALSAYADTVPSPDGLRSRGNARAGDGGVRGRRHEGQVHPSRQQPQQQDGLSTLSPVPEWQHAAASPCPTDEGRGLSDPAAGRTTTESEAGRRRAYDMITTGGGDGRLPSWRAIPEEPRGGDGEYPDPEGRRRDQRRQAGGGNDGATDVTADPSPDDGGGGSRAVWTASDSERRRFDRSIRAGLSSSPGSGAALAPEDGGAAPAPRGGPGGGADAVRFPVLQPDAHYEEHYGDLYVDQLLRYLYPDGYQSMRPRSGPLKLSVLIFAVFLWLSVFIVGHCYDRGQARYHGYDNDDEYLAEADDDAFVIETRWCGSRGLYFMWMASVWISVLALSYCSIIGYVKVRDVAVANGRSQPCLGGGEAGRSDFYSILGDGTGGSAGPGPGGPGTGRTGSYQGGAAGARDGPAIYQSDGQPQFWGGHIYRPTQAAVTMTNRP